MIPEKYCERFVEDGFVKIEQFFDLSSEIAPLQDEITEIVSLAAGLSGVDGAEIKDFASARDAYARIVQKDRGIAAKIYDGFKHLPALLRLVSAERVIRAADALMPGARSMLAAYGYGIRCNNPGETRFLAPWHQDIHTQGRAYRGLVMWVPLVPVRSDLGPVEFAVGSHKTGPRRVRLDPAASSIYRLKIVEEKEEVSRFPHTAPESDVGDAIFIDYATIHRSGENRTDLPLLSVQSRYFDLLDRRGFAVGWGGPSLRPMDLEGVFPELLSKSEAC